jgi:hypothetical protein
VATAVRRVVPHQAAGQLRIRRLDDARSCGITDLGFAVPGQCDVLDLRVAWPRRIDLAAGTTGGLLTDRTRSAATRVLALKYQRRGPGVDEAETGRHVSARGGVRSIELRLGVDCSLTRHPER